MRAKLNNEILYISIDDLPQYKRSGSIVRNSYFWALRSIAGRAPRNRDWEFESDVWVALQRMLESFAMSGYLGTSETILEFSPDTTIPALLRPVATWGDGDSA